MEEFVSSRDGRIWTTSEGEGPAVLLCNGGPGCCDYLQPVADMLKSDVRVIRFEQSGCGRSDPTPPYDIATCLQDMERVRLHYGLDRWIVGGHSWGADLALIYTLQFPERVVGFFCIAGGRFHNDREWHRLYDERRGLEVLPPMEFPPNMEVNRQGNASWKQYMQRPTLWRELSNLTIPGVFLYGEQDIRPSWPVEQVAHTLPNARFHMFAGADHYIWTSDAEPMKALLREFVQSTAVA